MHPDQIVAISHLYPLYAQALDEKRFELLERVFTPDAELHYVVGEHEFRCTGAEAAAAFRGFLDRCWWTNHIIAAPAVSEIPGGVRASARVVATHLQRLPEGTLTQWLVRGSYHDVLVQAAGGWRITHRYVFCASVEGEFLHDGVELFPTCAWAGPDQIG